MTNTTHTVKRAASPRVPASQPVLLRALRWGGIATTVLVIVCGSIGWLLSQWPGLIGGVLGSILAGVLLGLTAGSIAFANRFIAHEMYVGIFFGTVLGIWLLKLILFVVAMLLLRDQPWVASRMLAVSLIAGVLVSLVIDLVIVVKSRVPVIASSAEKQ